MSTRKFILTSGLFTGEVHYTFTDGSLVEQSIKATLSEEQQKWLWRNTVTTIDELQQLVKAAKQAKLTEVSAVPTFLDFWDRYNDKIRSSKIRAEKVWKQLSDADKVRALSFVGVYVANITGNIEKKHAETYLRARQWNN